MAPPEHVKEAVRHAMALKGGALHETGAPPPTAADGAAMLIDRNLRNMKGGGLFPNSVMNPEMAGVNHINNKFGTIDKFINADGNRSYQDGLEYKTIDYLLGDGLSGGALKTVNLVGAGLHLRHLGQAADLAGKTVKTSKDVKSNVDDARKLIGELKK